MDLYGIDTNALSQDNISNGMIEENKSIKEDVEDTLEGMKSRYCSADLIFIDVVHRKYFVLSFSTSVFVKIFPFFSPNIQTIFNVVLFM